MRKQNRPGFIKTLSCFDATMMVAGNVIGVGIFTTSGILAQELPTPLYFLGIWVVGGVLSLAGALTYSELAAAIPQAGGDYNYLTKTYGTWAGFLLGWVYFFIIMPGSIAALSVALVKYLSFFFPGLNGFASKTSVACLVILVLSFTNYRGIKWGSRVQNFLTTLVIGIVVSLIVLGFFSRAGDLSHFASLSNGDFSLQKFLGPAMIAVIFTYSGWFASAYIASEIKNPERNLPLSLIWGTLIVTVLYLTLNSVYLYALSIDDMKGVINIAQKAGVTLFGPKAGAIVSGVIILATLGSINATIAIAPRVYFAMANDGIFPEMIGRLHSKYHTPHVSIIVQAMLSGFLVFWGTFQQLLSYVVFAMLVSSIATGCSIFILRIRKPDMNRPYKTLGYPFTPILFVGAYMWIAIQILLHKPYEAIIGLAIIATGIPFYFCWKKERN